MATFEDVKRKIAELPGDVFRVFNSSKQPPTDAELTALEAALGRPLSKGLRELLATWGVLIVEVAPEVWPRPQALEVLPAWRFQFGFQVLGVGKAVPPALTIAGARTPELDALGARPFLRRQGVKFLSVSTTAGVGVWAPGDEEVEELSGDELDRVLFEIRELEDALSKLRSASSGATELVEAARAAGFRGPRASDALEALVKRPSDDLAPHLPELARGFLIKDASMAMGCLDVIAAAGKGAFPSVAELVYAHFGRSDDPWVLELLGKVEDVSPRALELFAEGLASDDDDTVEKALEAVAAVAKAPEARTLVSAIEERLDDDELEGEQQWSFIAVLGPLGAPSFIERASAALEEVESDNDFVSFVGAFNGLSAELRPLSDALLERFRAMRPEDPAAFRAVEALAAQGISDRPSMEPVVRRFHERGGGWAKRATKLLANWGG